MQLGTRPAIWQRFGMPRLNMIFGRRDKERNDDGSGWPMAPPGLREQICDGHTNTDR